MATQEETSVLLETPVSNISNGVVTSNPMVEDTAGDADMARQFAIQATADFNNSLCYATLEILFVNVPNSFMMTYGLKNGSYSKFLVLKKYINFETHFCAMPAKCGM